MSFCGKRRNKLPHLGGQCFPFLPDTPSVEAWIQQPWQWCFQKSASRHQVLLYSRETVFPTHPSFLTYPKLFRTFHITSEICLTYPEKVSYFKFSPFFFLNAIAILTMQRLCHSKCLRLSYIAVIMKSNFNCTASHSENSREFCKSGWIFIWFSV